MVTIDEMALMKLRETLDRRTLTRTVAVATAKDAGMRFKRLRAICDGDAMAPDELLKIRAALKV